MIRRDQPEIEIINAGPHDHFSPRSPMRDDFELQRSPRRSSRRVDDDLLPSFQHLDLGGKKDKVKDRKRSVDIQAGRLIRRRSSGDERRPSRYYEYYRFEKRGDDWNVADKIQMMAPQEELERRVAKGKNKSTVLENMTNMNSLRRDQINRLLREKNYAEKDKDAQWVPMLIETIKQRGRYVLTFDIIIAQSIKSRGSTFRDKHISFVGEKSDLGEPIRSRGKDKEKDKYRDNSYGKKRNDYEDDPFGNRRPFTNDGRPIDSHGEPFDAQQSNRPPFRLEDPVAGPIPGLQPMRPPPNGWNDPFRPGEFPQDMHLNQPPVEILPDHHQPHMGPVGGDFLDLDQFLEKPQEVGGGGGGGGGPPPLFDQPRLENFAGPGPDEFRPMGSDRQRSTEQRKSESRRPRPNRIYTDQGPRRPRERSRRYQYGESSIDDEDEVVSVFFDGSDHSSASSYSMDPDRYIERRGSLKRRPSARRGERAYREHDRRRASFNPGRRDLVIEPGRTPRRPGPERRQTIAWTEPPRQITYPSRFGRGNRDVIEEALSPGLTQRSSSPGGITPGRRESRAFPPELYYPADLAGKDRRAQEYMDAVDRDREQRIREDELRWQERDLDERERRRGEKAVYREHRDRDRDRF